jgi:hypothetical protein
MQHIQNETNRAKKAQLLFSTLRAVGATDGTHGQSQKG